MDIVYLGQSSFKLKGKNSSVVTDPYDPSIGLRLPKTEAEVVTISHDHSDHNASNLVSGEPFVVAGPGEYEVKGIKIIGVESSHDTKSGKELGKNTMFNFKIDGVSICHLGDLGQAELTSNQIDDIGKVDVLLVPVGGVYTIDGQAATKMVSSLEPKIVIPMHFGVGEGQKLEPVENFLKEMGTENVKREARITVSKEKIPGELQVVVLERKA